MIKIKINLDGNRPMGKQCEVINRAVDSITKIKNGYYKGAYRLRDGITDIPVMFNPETRTFDFIMD